jgi:uncharacterized protein (TIGR02594 family)
MAMKQPIPVTPYSLAQRYVGVREVAGSVHNPLVVAMLKLVTSSTQDDETPWCSAFTNWISWNLQCKRSNSLAARSWLKIGTEVWPGDAVPGFHVVVLQRGVGPQPPASVLAAPGHVGFFAGWTPKDDVLLLGGNQADAVSVAAFPRSRILGIREI